MYVKQFLIFYLLNILLPELTPTKNLMNTIQYFTDEAGKASRSEYPLLAKMNRDKEQSIGARIEPDLLPQ
jgi:hypothetical protein